MVTDSRNYSKYSMGFKEFEKLKKIEARNKNFEAMKNSPMAKSATRLLVKAACIAAVVVVASSAIQKNQDRKAESLNRKRAFLMSEAENKALDFEKTSDAVSVMRKYSPNISDLLTESLKELGITVSSNTNMENDRFLQLFIDTMDSKFENKDKDAYNYGLFLKKAAEMAIKKNIFNMVSHNTEFINNGWIPKSYQDIEFVSNDSFKDNASVRLHLEGAVGPYVMTISDSVVGSQTKMPNNLLELICNINEKGSIIDKNGLARFISDFEKWAVDTQNYSIDKNNKIAVKGNLDVNKTVNSAHREIRDGYRAEIYNSLLKEYNLGKGLDEI